MSPRVSAEPPPPNGSALQRFTRAKAAWRQELGPADQRAALVMFMEIIATLTGPKVTPSKNAICEALEDAVKLAQQASKAAPVKPEEAPQ